MKALSVIICLWFSAYGLLYAEYIEVVDDLDDRLVLQKPAEKIIALSPHLAELVFEAGVQDKLVATVEYADFPSAAKKIPRLGSYNALDFERILAFDPDVVLAWHSGGGDMPVKKLRQLGLKVYVSEPVDLTDISRTLRDIGKLAGNSDFAEKKALEFDQQVAILAREYEAKKKVRLFYQVWHKPLITINGRQLISRVFELCGGENIFSALPSLAPVVSMEQLLLADPSAIIGGAGVHQKQHWLKLWHNWPALQAVRNANLFFVNPDLLNRQTPRMLMGARQVCAILEQVRKKGPQYD